MDKYLITIILNFPIIIFGLIRSVASFKNKKHGKKRAYFEISFWVFTALVVLFIEPAYNMLVVDNLTNSEPLSIFDTMMITAINSLLFLNFRASEKISALEYKVDRLHESIVSMDRPADHLKK